MENNIYVIMPKDHLQVMLSQYLYKVGALTEGQRIDTMLIPVTVDDEDNITLEIILSGSIN